MDRRMISPLFVQDALDGLRAADIPVAPLLARAGIDADLSAPVTADQFGALWLAMADAMQDEFFGLAARPMRPGSFALMGHAVLHAGTLEQALHRALRFLRVVLDAPHGQLLVTGGQAQVVLSDPDGPRSAFAYRTFWLILHGMACWLVGRRIPLQRVDFACAPPGDRIEYRVFFGAPVRFDQPHSLLAFDAGYLKLPIHRSEQALKQFLRGAPANLLVRYRHDAGLSARVRDRLRGRAATDWPGFDALAADLRLSPATLRRRLRAEGQSFAAIRDELRFAEAQRLLRDTAMTVAELAQQLGFSEPSAFHRAFLKWSGQSPGRFRRAAGSIAGDMPVDQPVQPGQPGQCQPQPDE